MQELNEAIKAVLGKSPLDEIVDMPDEVNMLDELIDLGIMNKTVEVEFKTNTGENVCLEFIPIVKVYQATEFHSPTYSYQYDLNSKLKIAKKSKKNPDGVFVSLVEVMKFKTKLNKDLEEMIQAYTESIKENHTESFFLSLPLEDSSLIAYVHEFIRSPMEYRVKMVKEYFTNASSYDIIDNVTSIGFPISSKEDGHGHKDVTFALFNWKNKTISTVSGNSSD
jgi:hypothetical protein